MAHHRLSLGSVDFHDVQAGRRTFDIRDEDELRDTPTPGDRITYAEAHSLSQNKLEATVGVVSRYEQRPGFVVFSLRDVGRFRTDGSGAKPSDHVWGDRIEHLLFRLLDAINGATHTIVVELRKLGAHPPTPTVGLAVTSVIGRNPPMSSGTIIRLPKLEMSNVERVQLSLAPKLPDGSADPGPFTWTSSDSSIASLVGLVPAGDLRIGTVDTTIRPDGSLVQEGDPDPTNTAPSTSTVWALTPAGAGTADIVAESASPSVDGNLLPLELIEGRHGNVNLSAGQPVSDL